MTKEECLDLRNGVIAELREITCKHLGVVDELSDEMEIHQRLQMMFEAVAYEMGYVEGVVVIMGAEVGERDTSRRRMLIAGKEEALRNHSATCDGCEAGDDLKREIQPN